MKKSQILTIISLILAFLAFDLAFYHGITKRYKNSTNPEMQAKSIEISKFLPFDENSHIYKTKADLNLTGDLPVIDGAAALFPVFSAFVNAIYPKDSVKFDGENFSFDPGKFAMRGEEDENGDLLMVIAVVVTESNPLISTLELMLTMFTSWIPLIFSILFKF